MRGNVEILSGSVEIAGGPAYAGPGAFVVPARAWQVSKDWGLINANYSNVRSLEVGNGLLWAGIERHNAAAELWYFDKITGTWTQDGTLPRWCWINALKWFNGFLWIGTGNYQTGPNEAYVYKRTSAGSYAVSLDQATNYATVRCLEEFGGELFAGLGFGSDGADVWGMTAGEAWTLRHTAGGNSVPDFALFNGKLVHIRSRASQILVYETSNGQDYTQIADSSWLGGAGTWVAIPIVSHASQLFVHVGAHYTTPKIYRYVSGNNWSEYTDLGSVTRQPLCLLSYGGKLLCGVKTGGSILELSLGSYTTQVDFSSKEYVYAMHAYKGLPYAAMGGGQSENGDAEVWVYA